MGLSLLDSEVTIGTNLIGRLYTPTYYVVEDRLVIEDNAAEICALDTIKYLPSQAMYNLVYPMSGEVRWFTADYGYDEHAPGFASTEARLQCGATVTYTALQLAYLMGFEQVYIIGLDHDYQMPAGAVEISPNVYMSNGDDPNHFDPAYFGAGKRFHDPKPDRMVTAYKRAREVYEAAGREILNASTRSKTRVFKRAKLEDVL